MHDLLILIARLVLVYIVLQLGELAYLLLRIWHYERRRHRRAQAR